MPRSRVLSLVFVLLSFATGGAVLHHFQGPFVTRAAAQTSREPGMPGTMQAAKPAVRKAVIATIQAQLAAFQKGDYQKAVQYQSAGLKQNFPSTDRFRQMMETAYPEFVHSKKVLFGAIQSDLHAQRVFVPVTVTGQNGVTVKAAYVMVLEGKAYRVAGVLGGVRPTPLPMMPDAAAA